MNIFAILLFDLNCWFIMVKTLSLRAFFYGLNKDLKNTQYLHNIRLDFIIHFLRIYLKKIRALKFLELKCKKFGHHVRRKPTTSVLRYTLKKSRFVKLLTNYT